MEIERVLFHSRLNLYFSTQVSFSLEVFDEYHLAAIISLSYYLLGLLNYQYEILVVINGNVDDVTQESFVS